MESEKPCSRCGKCCTNSRFMGGMTATREDVERWIREGRDDILEWVEVIGTEEDPWADLWISQVTRTEASICPFVRKDENRPTYRCLIYETRPQVCRDYTPFWPGNICEDIKD